MRADIHDGPEHMLQSETGYIDARPLNASSTKPLATHGRTIHSGQSRRFCDVCFSVRYPQYRTFTSDWDWPACRLAAPELQTTGAAAAAPAFCPRPAKRHELHLRSTKTRHINCAKSTRKLLASCLSWFLSDGGLANDSAGPARRRQPTA